MEWHGNFDGFHVIASCNHEKCVSLAFWKQRIVQLEDVVAEQVHRDGTLGVLEVHVVLLDHIQNVARECDQVGHCIFRLS